MLFINISFLLVIVFQPRLFLFDIPFKYLLILILEFFNFIITLFIGLFSLNKYIQLSTNRLVNFLFSFEVILIFFFLIFSLITKVISFNFLLLIPRYNFFFFLLWPLILLIVLFLLQRAPFDLIEAETELIMGYTTEYSAFWFGVLVLIEYLHFFFFLVIFSAFFSCLNMHSF